jgi:hypothetical protein
MLTMAFVALLATPVVALMLMLGLAELEAALFRSPDDPAPEGGEEDAG